MSYDVYQSQVSDSKNRTCNESYKNINEDVTGAKAEKMDISTPFRKISSSKFVSAFVPFYGGSSSGSSNSNTNSNSNNEDPITTTGNNSNNPNAGNSSGSSNRTPTRGMESKIMSMWHNVRYGWGGKMKTNFSREQPVWLLGRCYHRKFSPPPSMESSAEFTSNLEVVKTNLLISPETNITGGAVGLTGVGTTSQILGAPSDEGPVQELGTDVIENQITDNPWEEGIEGFKRDFYSRLWMTYRREFPIMNGTNYTSDCGWGCMLRSGQMLLAQALIVHFLGRSWRWDPETQLHTTYEDHMHRKIIRWFGDSSSKSSPFSIHTLVNLGEQEMGKKAGDWYGPSSVSFLIKQAVKQAALENADFDNLIVYVAKDCTVYIQDILDECEVPEKTKKYCVPWHQTAKDNPESKKFEIQTKWKSVIILVPLRLGADKLNPIYAHCLKLMLSTEYCIGIIGGRPKHSLYFVGFQEDKLIHLDPHYCQEMVDVNQENFPVNSFHCKSPRKMKVNKMDPSCCIGFYCQTRTDFDNFISCVQPYLHPSRTYQPSSTEEKSTLQLIVSGSATTSIMLSPEMSNYPMFLFVEGRSIDYQQEEKPETPFMLLQSSMSPARQNLYNDEDDEDETEEFVML